MQLLPLVYEELRFLARQRLNNEKPEQTLQATALVHEAYLRLVGNDNDQSWDNRGHVFAAGTKVMRPILDDKARKKKTIKHGGHLKRVELCDAAASDETPPDELLALDAALTKLQEKDHVKADLVKLRYFTGLTIPQAAEMLSIGVSTADKYWAYAKP